jgi:hypothetical protein
VPNGRDRLAFLPDPQSVRDAAVAQPRDRHTDEKRFRETQFGEVPTPRLGDGTAVRQLIRFD